MTLKILSVNKPVILGWQELAQHILRLNISSSLTSKTQTDLFDKKKVDLELTWVALDSPSHQRPLLKAMSEEIGHAFLPCRFLEWPSMPREKTLQWQLLLYVLLQQKELEGLDNPALLMKVIQKNMVVFEEILLHRNPEANLAACLTQPQKELWLLGQIDAVLRPEHPTQYFLNGLIQQAREGLEPKIICVGERWKEMMTWFEKIPKPSVIYQVDWQTDIHETFDEVHEKERASLSWLCEDSLEKQALSAYGKIKEWIDLGIKDIALIPNDRLLARRLSALLARDGLSIQDDQGWPLVESREAVPLLAWFDWVCQPSNHALIRLLNQAWTFSEQPLLKNECLKELQQYIQTQDEAICSDIPSWQSYVLPRLNLSQSGLMFVHSILNLSTQWVALNETKDPKLVVDLFEKTWEVLGFEQSFKQHEVGLNIKACCLEILNFMKSMPELLSKPLRLVDWIFLLQSALHQTFWADQQKREKEENQPKLVFSSLLALSRLPQQAVMVLGAGIDVEGTGQLDERVEWLVDGLIHHLKSTPSSSLMFWKHKKPARLQKNTWADLLSHACDHLSLVWLSDHASSIKSLSLLNYLSNALSSMAALDLSEHWLQLGGPDQIGTLFQQVPMGQIKDRHLNDWPSDPLFLTQTDLDLLPSRLSVTALNTLQECSYRFFLESIAGVRSPNVQNWFDVKILGQLLHEVLAQFHDTLSMQFDASVLNDIAIDFYEQGHVIWKKVSGELIEKYRTTYWSDHPLSHLQTLDWKIHLDELGKSYLKWWHKQYQMGWRVIQHEKPIEYDTNWIENYSESLSKPLSIRGRIDRIDEKEEEKRILDYKNQSVAVLRGNKEKDLQLPFYGWLEHVQSIEWLSVKKERVMQVPFYKKNSKYDLAVSIPLFIDNELKSLAHGKKMKAVPDDRRCTYCQKQGICRTDLSRKIG
jgi:ATP-dependent helicase/nuclease subunit B